MVGNLKFYFGAASLDIYSEWLREVGEPALPRRRCCGRRGWCCSLAVGVHIHAAYALTLINRRARPEAYRSKRDYVAADFASRTMRWTGIIVLLFVIFHLLDLTWGPANPDFIAAATRTTTSSRASSAVPVAMVYIVANLALGVHLYHGAWSMFQSMGWVLPWRREFAIAFAAMIVIGNVSFPLAVMLGVVELSVDARVADPAGLDPAGVGQPPLHGPAGERVQQAALQRDRGRDRPGGRERRRHAGRARLRGRRSSRSMTRRGARTRSPPRAGSTPPRTTATTATAIFRLFYDTIKGGDFRSREANVYRLAQVSNEIIDQATAQGVPFAREYGGLLDNRSFGGAQVSRTFYARGQTGQQLLLGAYQAMMRQVAAGKITLHTRTEMLDVVVDEGKARGVVVRDLLTRRGPLARPRTPSCWPPAATRTRSSCRRTRRRRTRPRSGARTSAARRSRTRASRRSIRPASRSPTTRSPS